MLERKLVAILELDHIKKGIKIQEAKLESLGDDYKECKMILCSFDYGSHEHTLLGKKLNNMRELMFMIEVKIDQLYSEYRNLCRELGMYDDYPSVGYDYVGSRDWRDDLTNNGFLRCYKF